MVASFLRNLNRTRPAAPTGSALLSTSRRRLFDIFILALALAASPNACSSARTRPDVVLILIDTLRADHLSLLGYPRETAPATASLVTGRYPTDHGIVEGFMAHRAHAREREEDEVEKLGASTLTLDIVPTLLDLAGVEAPPELDGVSLPAESDRSPPPIFAHRQERDRHLWAVLQDRWKLIDDGRSPAPFDLRNDRAEQRNLAADHPEITDRLSTEIDRFKTGALERGGTQIDVPLDQRTLETLRTLGYVD